MNEDRKTIERLTFGIVTHNNQNIIQYTLDSILNQLPEYFLSTIYIVDNASTDDTLRIVYEYSKEFKNLKVYESKKNLGFGRAHNKIIKLIDSDYHIICNPDIIICTQAIEIIIEFLQKNYNYGIVCPKFFFPDGSLQPLNRLNPTIWDLFLRRFLPKKLYYLFENRMNRYEMLDIGYNASYEVPFVSGAFMVCRTSAIKQVNGFDRRYFLYFEDADLSRKIQENGWLTCYCPEASVIHEWKRDSHKSIKSALIFLHSAYKYFHKWGWKIY